MGIKKIKNLYKKIGFVGFFFVVQGVSNKSKIEEEKINRIF